MTNYPDAALTQLKKVFELEPKDVVAQSSASRCLPRQLRHPSSRPCRWGSVCDRTGRPTSSAVGLRLPNETAYELTLNDSQQFAWTVTPKAGPVVKQTGRYTATSDRLILESAGQETLVVKVNSQGADRFQFSVTAKTP